MAMNSRKPPQPASDVRGGKLWYRFRMFTDKHSVKLIYLWAAVTVTTLGVMQYQYVHGKSSPGETVKLILDRVPHRLRVPHTLFLCSYWLQIRFS